MEAKPPICVIHEIFTLQIYSKYFIRYFMLLKSHHLFLSLGKNFSKIFLPHIGRINKTFIYDLNGIDPITEQIFLDIFMMKLDQY